MSKERVELKVQRVEKEPTSTVGAIEVICGGMFSGKSDELIRRLKRAPFAKKTAQVFIPFIENRRGSDTINTFDGDKHPAISVISSLEILDLTKDTTDWVAIDEAQFFDSNLPEVCNTLAQRGKRVIVAGLDANFRGESFGPMDDLIRDAEKVDKLNAQCAICGGIASRTQRLKIVDGQQIPVDYDDPIVQVGERQYQARCRFHHEVPGKPE